MQGLRTVNLRLLAATLAFSATSALAHHGWSEYDSTKELTLTGKIGEAGYEHPHGYVKLTVDGKAWTAVLAPPSRMENRGLPRTDLKPGATVTVVGYANRNKPEEMRAERIIVGGRTIELR
jgi:membrane protein implicated in regulation of membrane protease activity